MLNLDQGDNALTLLSPPERQAVLRTTLGDLFDGDNWQPVVQTTYQISVIRGLSYKLAHDNPIMIIGNDASCDIPLSNLPAALAGVFCLTKEQVFLFDLESSVSMKVLKREFNNDISETSPNKRNVLSFSVDESVTLEIGSNKLELSPELCIICCLEKQTCGGKCGHNNFCQSCFNRINQGYNPRCPICRIDIREY